MSQEVLLDQALVKQLQQWAKELGFAHLGISNIDLSESEIQLQAWLERQYQGDMDWMARHGTKRSRPEELVEGTLSIISVRMDYQPEERYEPTDILNHPNLGFISRYALGRDYHKVLKQRLEKLSKRLQQYIGQFGYRVFVDSAPVLEKAIGAKAGLGWQGKHSNLLSRDAGSYFFLGEIYTDLALPETRPVEAHCGKCTACIDICPTQAIVEPYVVDARRCISYLTIELKGSIPIEFRKAIGNRIYGCDDCQLACPWNRFAQLTQETDFDVRHHLDCTPLLELWMWTEQQFLDNLAGTAIRRIGYERWQRNLAVALGNAITSPSLLHALHQRLHETDSHLVKEHIIWALNQHESTTCSKKST